MVKWYNNLDRFLFRFVAKHAFDRQTDGQTDRILIARPHLHSMQRCKYNRYAYLCGTASVEPNKCAHSSCLPLIRDVLREQNLSTLP